MTTNGFVPSHFQEAIFEWVQDRHATPDAIVKACAGSGKTTVLVEAAKLLPRGRPSLFCAFNRHIAETLKQRLIGTGMTAMTIHGIGMSTLYRSLGRDPKLEDRKYWMLIRSYVAENKGDFKDVPAAASHLNKLCRFVRLTLTDYTQPEYLRLMAVRYNLDYEEPYAVAVRSLIEHGNRLAEDSGEIDFCDMIWLPHHLRLQPKTYPWVMIDESQDLCRAQLDLVLKSRAPGGRMLFVGDPRQSIQMFAGADSQSYEMIRDGLGAKEFPLSICYRCPTSVIKLAQEIVPEIQARPGAPAGTIIEKVLDPDRTSDFILANAQQQDLIMCRRNAPLLKHCLRLIRHGIQARVRGRDVGKELADLARSIGATCEFARFPSAVVKYREEHRAALVAKDASDAVLEMLSDKCDAIQECYDGFRSSNAEEMAKKIENIFADSGTAVWFSTIHRGKGLQSPRTWILDYDRLGIARQNSSREEIISERNIKYVAITRCQDTMYILREKEQKGFETLV